MSPSIFLTLRTNFFASQTTKSNICIKNQTTPPSILRKIPLSIESCLSEHLSNEKIFKESAQIYQEALKKSGYNHQLTYQKSINNKNKDTKRCKRKTSWFNPPYSKNVSIKVGNQFLKLVNNHKFYKLFNYYYYYYYCYKQVLYRMSISIHYILLLIYVLLKKNKKN